MSASQDELRKWILANMTSEALSELDLYKEEAAKFLALSPDGTIILRVDRSKVDMPTEILLVLLGRAYAAAAGLAANDELTNEELFSQVKGTSGGQRWALTKLREENLIASAQRGSHHLLPSQVGRSLKVIKDKLKV